MKKSIHNEQYRQLIKMLRSLRESKGITQEQLASKLNITQGIVSKIESCERRIDVIETRNICNALDFSFCDFVNLVENELSKQ